MSALLLAACLAPAARAFPDRADDLPVVDGSVQTVLRTPERIYVGGNFNHVSTRTGPFFLTDAAGAPRLPSPDVSGGRDMVEAMAPDGAGGFYIVGNFTHVDGLPRLGAARILADGSVDPNWAPSVPGEVFAVRRSGNTVYIGGHFSSVDGLPRSNLAAVDASTGQVEAFAPALDGVVSVLAVSGSSVYFSLLGGSQVNGVARAGAAAVDATTGVTLAWDPEPNGQVAAIEVAAGKVYLRGGEFTQIDGAARKYLAAVDPTSGADTGLEAAVDKTVTALAVSGSTLYVGGLFTHAGATAVGHAAAFDLDGNLKSAWTPGADNAVLSIASDGGAVYLGGTFTHIDGTVATSGFAAVDPVTGVATGWAPTPNLPGGSPRLVTLSGANVAIGGSFNQAGGVARHDVAAFSATDGRVLPWNPDPDQFVDAIADDGSGHVYIGGYFEHVNGDVPRFGLAEVDAETGAATRFNIPADAGHVTALALDGETLYVGGPFIHLGNQFRRGLGAIDLATDSVTQFEGPLDGSPTALLVRGSTIYVGGAFSLAGGAHREGAAAFPTTPTQATPTAWDPDVGWVTSIAQRDGTIYLASGGASVAAVDDATGAPVPGFRLSVSYEGVPEVDSVSIAGDVLYLGGIFESVNGMARRNAAAVDAETGAPAPWEPEPDGPIRSVSADPSGSVTIGGDFTTTELRAASGFASYSDPPTVLTSPSVTGDAVVGGSLTCGGASFGGAQPQSTNFAWLRDGEVIAGTVGDRYVVGADEVGHWLSCRVTARNLGGSAAADSAGVSVQATGGGPPSANRAAPDRGAPKVSALKLTPSSFRAASKGGPVTTGKSGRKGPGTEVSYKVDEAARITFTVQRREPGRRKGRSCVKPTKTLAKAGHCTRYVTVKGSLERTAKVGGFDRFRFTGRLSGRSLTRGSYRLALLAADAAGNEAAPVVAAFHVLRPRSSSP
ncbi:MAG TPA: hypothetical protein VGC32_17075 [Solirubrobacterales bacterium]